MRVAIMALAAAPEGLRARWNEGPLGAPDAGEREAAVVAITLNAEPHPLDPGQMVQHFGVLVLVGAELRNVIGAKLSTVEPPCVQAH